MGRSSEDYDPLREVREIVALIEEGAKPPEPPPVRPSAWDAIWLALTVINGGLLLWLVPDKVLKSDALDLLSGKVAPWLATSVFVAGYTWFRDEVLSFTRSRYFRALQIPLFVFLVFMEVPFVVVKAQLTPNDAGLWLDGERITQVFGEWRGSIYTHQLHVLPRAHHLELKPPDTWRTADISGQVIELSVLDVYDVLFRGRKPFHWSLVVPVTLRFPGCRPNRIIAFRRDDEFDSSYFETYGRSQQLRPVGSSVPYDRLSDDAKSFSALEVWMPDKPSTTIRLPAGAYSFVALRDWGEEPQEAALSEFAASVLFMKCNK